MYRRYGMILGVLVLWALLPQLVEAQTTTELRCTELGPNCKCSEPFNATSISSGKGGNLSAWDTNVVKDKPCVAELGYPVVRNNQDLIMSADAGMMAKLPATSTISHFLAQSGSLTGTFEFGQMLTGPADGSDALVCQRYVRGVRGTVFQSGNYGLKIFFSTFGPSGTLSNPALTATLNGTANASAYSYAGLPGYQWTPSVDCCVSGPGPNHGLGTPYWNSAGGKWIRVEECISNPGGNGVSNPGQGPVYKVYVKDITRGSTDTTEYTIIDTSTTCTGCVAGTGADFTVTSAFRTPPGVIRGPYPTNYRESPSSGEIFTCCVVAARWTTNAGQRIGPVYEIEGGGGTPPDTNPPQPPQGLKLTELFDMAETCRIWGATLCQ